MNFATEEYDAGETLHVSQPATSMNLNRVLKRGTVLI
jgi:hypothetical protein